VTLSNVPQNNITPQNNDWDEDGEMDVTPGTLRSQEEFIISKKDFEKLLQPPPAPPQQQGGMGGGMGLG
jgi:hypothetical protein